MVYKLNDFKHIDLMNSLSELQPIEEDQIVLESETFDENMLKLFSSLRANGLDKYADKLEEKFVSFKTAATHLYNTHDETGEDVIEFAHPKEEKHSEETIYSNLDDIVKKHKVIVDTFQKEPNGKLAAYINSVKIALAESNDDIKDRILVVLDIMRGIYTETITFTSHADDTFSESASGFLEDAFWSSVASPMLLSSKTLKDRMKSYMNVLYKYSEVENITNTIIENIKKAIISMRDFIGYAANGGVFGSKDPPLLQKLPEIKAKCDLALNKMDIASASLNGNSAKIVELESYMISNIPGAVLKSAADMMGNILNNKDQIIAGIKSTQFQAEAREFFTLVNQYYSVFLSLATGLNGSVKLIKLSDLDNGFLKELPGSPKFKNLDQLKTYITTIENQINQILNKYKKQSDIL